MMFMNIIQWIVICRREAGVYYHFENAVSKFKLGLQNYIFKFHYILSAT